MFKAAENGSKVAIAYRNTQALRGKGRRRGGNNFTAFDVSPDFQRLLLGLLLFPANIGNHVVHHLRPGLEGFAGPGDRLVGADQGLFDPKFGEGEEGGNIALERTVGFDRHKSPFGAQPLPLERDNRGMLGI